MPATRRHALTTQHFDQCAAFYSKYNFKFLARESTTMLLLRRHVTTTIIFKGLCCLCSIKRSIGIPARTRMRFQEGTIRRLSIEPRSVDYRYGMS